MKRKLMGLLISGLLSCFGITGCVPGIDQVVEEVTGGTPNMLDASQYPLKTVAIS